GYYEGCGYNLWVQPNDWGWIHFGRREDGMPYWVFENQTFKHKAVIHRGDCPDCKRKTAGEPDLPGEKGERWQGPFDTVGAAVQAAITTGRTISQHDCTR